MEVLLRGHGGDGGATAVLVRCHGGASATSLRIGPTGVDTAEVLNMLKQGRSKRSGWSGHGRTDNRAGNFFYQFFYFFIFYHFFARIWPE